MQPCSCGEQLAQTSPILPGHRQIQPEERLCLISTEQARGVGGLRLSLLINKLREKSYLCSQIISEKQERSTPSELSFYSPH